MGIVTCTIGSLQVHGGSNGLGIKKWYERATPRRNTTKRPRAQGSIDVSRFYEGRTYSIDGIAEGTDAEVETLLTELAAAFALADSSILLKYQRDGADVERAWVTQATEFNAPRDSSKPGLVPWSVDLFSADPRVYSDTITEETYDPTTAGSGVGVTFPLVFPLTFPGQTTTELLAQNAGNFPTPPILTITGPVTNPIIDNDTTGKSIYTQNCALTASDTLEVDVVNRLATLNGSTARPDLIDPSLTKWFELEVGDNALRMRGSGMTSGETSLAVTFRNARI